MEGIRTRQKIDGQNEGRQTIDRQIDRQVDGRKAQIERKIDRQMDGQNECRQTIDRQKDGKKVGQIDRLIYRKIDRSLDRYGGWMKERKMKQIDRGVAWME